MSRLANPKASRVYHFPDGCLCEGAPHAQGDCSCGEGPAHPASDWMRIRSELGADDTSTLVAFDALGARGSAAALAFLLVGWNLTDDDGKALEPSPDNVRLLFADTWSEQFNDWLDKNVRMVTVPNASGGRSGTGTPATAPRDRTTRRRARSTTS